MGLELFTGAPPVVDEPGTHWVSHVPWEPWYPRAALSDPAGISESGLLDSLMLSAPLSTGSTPGSSLSGLNRAAHELAVYASRRRSRAAAQDSLPVAGQALRGGVVPPGSITRFQLSMGILLVRVSVSHGEGWGEGR